jgi:prepilin-type N-terminal cleavage/methylation domain-containing protein
MKNKNGFTLVELSIVLVIIGLIVGGVVGGQSLIKSARLNKVTVDVEKYKTAVRAFELQYDYFPGDLPNAQEYWPGCNSNSGGSDCNGDGNRLLRQGAGGEGVQAWQHLSLAGIIPGTYSGCRYATRTTDEHACQLGIPTIPASPLGGLTGFHFLGDQNNGNDNDCQCDDASGTLFGRMGKRILLGADNTGPWLNGGAISAVDAKSIDKKTDDGIAYSGDIRATNAAGGGACGPPSPWGAVPSNTSDYDTTETGEGCLMQFFID